METFKHSIEAQLEVEKLGIDVYDANDTHLFFEMDGCECEIEWDEVPRGITIQQLHQLCSMKSGCCGGDVDKDIMVCPTCKEHC